MSTLTACPICAVHSTIVPSEMESPILGTLMVSLSDSGNVRDGNAAIEK